MSPRQLLRSFEIRAPSGGAKLGDQTDKQVRQFPDAAGDEPLNATLDDFADILTSRVRLNAGANDWRQGPAGGGGGGSASLIHESPVGLRDGQNLAFTTSTPFAPQSLRFYVNGLRQAMDGDADFTVSESQGTGTGYDTLTMAWAPLDRDRLQVDYTPEPQSG